MTVEDYVKPNWETVYFEAPFGNGRWSATECTIGKDRYAYYVNWYEPGSTLPPHYKLQINYGDGTSSWQICLSHDIAYSRVMAAIREYEKKFGLNEEAECPTCSPKEDDFGYTYFSQTPSKY